MPPARAQAKHKHEPLQAYPLTDTIITDPEFGQGRAYRDASNHDILAVWRAFIWPVDTDKYIRLQSRGGMTAVAATVARIVGLLTALDLDNIKAKNVKAHLISDGWELKGMLPHIPIINYCWESD